MQKIPVPPYGSIHYRIDDFIRPWDKADTVCCVHGFCESSAAWNPWIPYLGKLNRVVRYDQRGFGQSTPMPIDFPWSLDVLADDLINLIETVSKKPVHIISAKIGGPVTVRAAVKRPDLVKTLTLCSTPIKGPNGIPVGQLMAEQGMRAYAETTMGPRLYGMPQEAIDWWVNLMSATAPSTAIGFMNHVSTIDVETDLPKLQSPTLVITVDCPKRPVEHTKIWQASIPNSELVILNSDSYHLSVTEADQCAELTAAFIEKNSSQKKVPPTRVPS
ncbi:MAG: alpha/beta fold hydrolase [Alphaproteobacteria bacterium]